VLNRQGELLLLLLLLLPAAAAAACSGLPHHLLELQAGG
jgi:hypothetical protein